jgi:outer membrane cobalamin receptor
MLVLAGPARAQEESADKGDRLDDIVITATKKPRTVKLEEVLIAFPAFNRPQIETSFANDTTDIGQLAPGMRLQTGGALVCVANLTNRGMGINSSIASDEATADIIVDRVYLPANYGALADTLDLDSIEILRGPRGTLFGATILRASSISGRAGRTRAASAKASVIRSRAAMGSKLAFESFSGGGAAAVRRSRR